MNFEQCKNQFDNQLQELNNELKRNIISHYWFIFSLLVGISFGIMMHFWTDVRMFGKIIVSLLLAFVVLISGELYFASLRIPLVINKLDCDKDALISLILDSIKRLQDDIQRATGSIVRTTETSISPTSTSTSTPSPSPAPSSSFIGK